MALPLPDPAIGVFDAGVYRDHDPGPPEVVPHAAAIPAAPRRVAIVGLTAAGDVLHFLPLIGAVRRAYPGAAVDWIVQDKARALVEGRMDLDRVLVFERHRWARGLLRPLRFGSTVSEILSFRRALRIEPADLLLDPQGTIKSAIINGLSGAPCRVGFAAGFGRELNHLSTNVRVKLPTRRMHRVKKSLWLLRALGIDVTGAGAEFPVPDAAQAAADARLAESGLISGAFAVIHPGTSPFGARKRWPLDRFATVADRLQAEHGLRPAFIIGPVERGMKDALLAAVRTAPAVALEPASLPELAGILRRAAVVIGSDSAPLHLASMLRRPVVGLYGPTDPALFAPYYPPAVVVVKGLPCPSCGAPHCNHPVPRMEAITVDEVMAGVAKVLDLARG